MQRLRGLIVRASLIASLALPLYFVALAAATRFGFLDWRIGYEILAVRIGQPLLLLAALAGFAALLMAISVTPRRGIVMALVAFALPVSGIAALYAMRGDDHAPPLHDISTDLSDPPAFSEQILAEREDIPGGNGSDLVGLVLPNGRRAIDMQSQAYPDISPVIAGVGTERAFELALETAREQGWQIGALDRASGRFEARTTSLWFGFVNDIVVRVRANPPGAIVDIRIAARTGDDDNGRNAARVRAFMQALKEKQLAG